MILNTTRYVNRSRREVDAVQLTALNGPAVWECADSKPYYDLDAQTDLPAITGLTVFTPEGRVKAEFDDWIVRSLGGEFRVFKPANFEQEHIPAEFVSQAATDNRPSLTDRGADRD